MLHNVKMLWKILKVFRFSIILVLIYLHVSISTFRKHSHMTHNALVNPYRKVKNRKTGDSRNEKDNRGGKETAKKQSSIFNTTS